METYNKIKERAKRSGISLVQLCNQVGISRDTLENWKRKEPNTLVILQKINKALEEAEEKKFITMVNKYNDESKMD